MSNTYHVASVPIRSISALEAAIRDLNALGVRAELRKNAIPRNYYPDQFRRHLGRKDEVADYVVHLPGSAYDVSILRDGTTDTYIPYFDPHAGSIAEQLGVSRPEGATDQAHVIGKLLACYSRRAAMEAATKQGLVIASSTMKPDFSWSITANA